MSGELQLVAFEKIQPYCSQCGSALVYDGNDEGAIFAESPYTDIRPVICHACGSEQLARFGRPVVDQKDAIRDLILPTPVMQPKEPA